MKLTFAHLSEPRRIELTIIGNLDRVVLYVPRQNLDAVGRD
jgi:hypothetical protein